MITSKNFTDGIAPFAQVAVKLKKLGIFLSLYDSSIDYKFECNTSLTTRLEQDFPFGLPLEKKIAMALTETQERRNNHLDDEEIEFINKFFGLKITREDIKRMGRFI